MSEEFDQVAQDLCNATNVAVSRVIGDKLSLGVTSDQTMMVCIGGLQGALNAIGQKVAILAKGAPIPEQEEMFRQVVARVVNNYMNHKVQAKINKSMHEYIDTLREGQE